jgi:predicted transcriptional regulator
LGAQKSNVGIVACTGLFLFSKKLYVVYMSFAVQELDEQFLPAVDSPVGAGLDGLEGAPSATASPEWGSFGSWAARNGERKALTEKAREICRLYVTGLSQVAIAQQLGCSPSTVGQWLRCEIGKAEVERLRGVLVEKTAHPRAVLDRLTVEAAEWYRSVMQGEIPVKDEIRLKVCQDIFDRSGISRNPHEDAARYALIDSREQLMEIKRIASESRKRIKPDEDGVIDIESLFDATREQVVHVTDSHDDGDSGAPDAAGGD